jgi:excinuclease ABC subunit C
MSELAIKIKSLPSSPGAYIFYGNNRKILYVGKAGSLKDRVGSYFLPSPASNPSSILPLERGGGRLIELFISEVKDLEIRKTDTVLEAYILEQDLIKKFQPKYNVDGKDDKSFCYVVVTKEEWPRFVVMRRTDLNKIFNFQFSIFNQFSIPNEKNSENRKELKAESQKLKASKVYGPYVARHQIEMVLKILRKIFPYHSKPQKTEKGCLDYQIGLCPGPYDGAISKADYQKNIHAIRMVLEGRKKSLVNKMKKEMEVYSDKNEFEKATEVRNKIFALQHIQDIALISGRDDNFEFRISNFETNSNFKNSNFKIDSKFKIKNLKLRIEGYDISNISGKYSVGSMVVFDNLDGELKPNKSQYRKFRIKTIEGVNDVGAMEEVLARRFGNNWPRPNLIILDGGRGHLNMARRVLRNFHLEIPLIAVAKGPTRKKIDVYSFGTVPEIPKNIIEQVRDEAHRFAIKYHRKLRGKEAIE